MERKSVGIEWRGKSIYAMMARVTVTMDVVFIVVWVPYCRL